MRRQMNVYLGVLILFLVVAPNAFTQTSTRPSGSGTPGDPFQIDSLPNLYWITQNSGTWDSSFVQTSDIDATPDTGWDSNQGFTPIGNGTTNFKGTYDGGGHTITGIYINRSSTYDVGMFGYATSATIENLGLLNVDITGHVAVGALVGDNTYGTVKNCSSSGSVTGSYFYDGSNYGSYVGGLMGGTAYVTVSNCSSTASASGQVYVGGFVGYMDAGSIMNNCYVNGNVNCQYSHFGGFAGSMVGCTVTNCYATGSAGGPYGSVYAGGFVGDNSSTTLTNCYSIGNVGGTNYVGGFSGADFGSSVSNCFWNKDTYGSSADGTGITTAEMIQSATFLDAGWSFSKSAWAMYPGINNGYPYLAGITQFSTPSPTSLSAALSSVTNISYTSATLVGNTNSGGDTADVWFLYGTSSGTYTDSISASSSPLVQWDEIQVSASLSSLKSGSTYYVQISAKNGSAYVRGSEASFATLTVAPPSATTGSGFTAHYTTANVNGVVDPNGDTTIVRFLYGEASGTYTDSVLASQSPLTVADSDSASVTLTGLMPNHIYYYRISATNGSGYTRGSEMSLHTLSPPEISTVPGTALSFNSGSSQYVSVSDNSSLQLTDNLTFEAWVYPTGSQNMAIIDKGNYNYLFEIRPNGQPGLGLYTNGTWYYSAGTVPDSTWSHVALVFQTGTNGIKFYLNGHLLSATTASGALTTNTGTFAIGEQAPGNCNCNFFQGMMDEVRVWGIVRTEHQIQSDMYHTLTGTETGLISYWQFNEGSGTVAADSISRNNGTLANGPMWVTSDAPVGKYGSYNASQSADTVGQSGSTVTATITSPVDSLNFLGVYSYGSPTDTPVTSETFPAGVDKRWPVIWGVYEFGADTANITLNYSLILGIQNEPTLKVLQREEVDSPWVDVTANFSQNTSTHTFAENGVSTFSQFSIGAGSDNVLPVEMTSFTAITNRLSANLLWKTATEVNTNGFEVQRSLLSANASTPQSWVDVAFVKGHSTSSAPNSYSYADRGLTAGNYSYRLKQIDNSGSVHYSKTVTVEVGSAPREFTLSQNYPNPFNPTTTIEFTLEHDGHVSLKVYDILGREVATLLDENQKAGEYQQVVFDGSRYSSGVYFAVLQAGGKQLMKKMLLLK